MHVRPEAQVAPHKTLWSYSELTGASARGVVRDVVVPGCSLLLTAQSSPVATIATPARFSLKLDF